MASGLNQSGLSLVLTALAAFLLLQYGEATRVRQKQGIHRGKMEHERQWPHWALRRNPYAPQPSSQDDEEIMIVDGSETIGEMRIERQGSVEYTGTPLRYSFRKKHLFKEYRATTGECDQAVYVRKGNGRLCSVGLFTTPELHCESADSGALVAETQRLSGFMPVSDRGFGLEFEFVARELDMTMEDKLYNSLVRKYGQWMAHFYMSMPQARLAALEQMCFVYKIPKLSNTSAEQLLSRWNWLGDSSVTPLSRQEVEALGASADESSGEAFEVTSPAPPFVLSGQSGFDSAIIMLGLLRDMGVQAGPSQGMHVHINVLSPNAPGVKLTLMQVAAVWAAYAKYQLVIDELLSPSRPGNMFAARLYFGNCPAKTYDHRNCLQDPCGCTRRFFTQMHETLKQSWTRLEATRESALDFCDAVLRLPGETSTPCADKYPHQRYFQLNLAQLPRHGTIEFRAHSATYDAERVMRWVQFLVGFVEYYARGPGFATMQPFLDRVDSDLAYKSLRSAQKMATFEELFTELGNNVYQDTGDFFKARSWEVGDAGCLPKGQAEVVKPGRRPRPRPYPPFSGRSPWKSCNMFHSFGGILSAVQLKGTDTRYSVQVPPGTTAESYLEVMMPEGNVRAVRVNEKSVLRGVHEFIHDPVGDSMARAAVRVALR